MNKAFIFDFDGVIIDNESQWEEAKSEMYQKLFGKEVFLRMGSTVGLSIDNIYEKATQCGASIDRALLVEEFHRQAAKIYEASPLTPGVDTIGEILCNLGYKIGIVSASPMEWIEIALNRTKLKNYIAQILSLREREDLQQKPSPDGYLEMMKMLEVSPQATIILEDSNAGIESAKRSGAYTIGFRQNLIEGYIQNGADVYADSLEDVIVLLKSGAQNKA